MKHRMVQLKSRQSQLRPKKNKKKRLQYHFFSSFNNGMFSIDKAATDGVSMLLQSLLSKLALCVTSESYS